MKIHYLEIVSSSVDSVCAAYAATHNIQFEPPNPLLGNARTAELADGTVVGVRDTLSDEEECVVRPYWLVDDINVALQTAERQGAVVLHPPLEIPGKGKFAIYDQGSIHHGLWQL